MSFETVGWRIICLSPCIALSVGFAVAVWLRKKVNNPELEGFVGVVVFFVVLFGVIFSIPLVLTLIPTNEPLATERLEKSLRDLPQLHQFETILVKKGVYPDRDNDLCYFGEAHMAIGTPLREDEAIKNYVEALQKLEWVQRGEQYPRSKGLYLNDKLINVSNPSGWILMHEPEYIAAITKYSSIIFVSLNYFPKCVQ